MWSDVILMIYVNVTHEGFWENCKMASQKINSNLKWKLIHIMFLSLLGEVVSYFTHLIRNHTKYTY